MRFRNRTEFTGTSGGKKLIYNGVTMPLTAIADFAEKGKLTIIQRVGAAGGGNARHPKRKGRKIPAGTLRR